MYPAVMNKLKLISNWWIKSFELDSCQSVMKPTTCLLPDLVPISQEIYYCHKLGTGSDTIRLNVHSPSRPPMLSSQQSPTIIALSALGPATFPLGCLCGWTEFLGVGVGFCLLFCLASLLSLKHKPIRTLSPLHASSG